MDGIANLLPYAAVWIAILAAFWWLTMRPMKRRQAEHRDLMEGLERGDMVVTAGGVHGEVVGLQEKTVTLEVAPDVRMKFDRRAIRRRYGDEEK